MEDVSQIWQQESTKEYFINECFHRLSPKLKSFLDAIDGYKESQIVSFAFKLMEMIQIDYKSKADTEPIGIPYVQVAELE